MLKPILRVAATLKPEKLQALLLKLRKSSVGSLKVKDILPVLDHLGGWKVSQEERAYPQGGKLYGKDEPITKGNKNQEIAQQYWEEAKRLERNTPPVELPVGKEAYMDVTPLVLNGEYWQFQARKWVGHYFMVVRAPSGKEFQKDLRGPSYVDEYVSGPIFDFMVQEGLLKQVNDALGTPSVQQEKAEKARNAPKPGNTGTCPCCFRTQKLTPKSKHGSDLSRPGMVLHGYERPGFGFIEGNCFGVGWPPFELSSEGTEAMIPPITKQIQNLKLSDLLERPEKVEDLADRFNVRKRHLKSETDPRDWESLLKEAVHRTKEKLSAMEDLKRELEQKARSWKPQPL